MKLRSTPHFDRRLSKRLNKNPQLKKKVNKQLKLLKKNIKHPSLKIHRLEGKRIHEFSIWIEGNLRITFQIIKDTILLTDIITHDEY
jgi:mRNA-degrading endonuclease YafQ of YafQ-DinJ toxin-antitoxin module